MERYKQYFKESYGKLKKEQMEILDQYVGEVISYDDLPADAIKELKQISNHETMWSDAERYLHDSKFKK